jgi:SAM-dependent methyltransferase
VKRTAPLALRNAPLLLETLRWLLPAPSAPSEPTRLLELGSGTGEHAIAFARALPHALVQPSDPDPEARASIRAWAGEARLPNLAEVLDLELLAPAWRRQPFDLLVCVNVLHLAPAEASAALLDGLAAAPAGRRLLLYGPFWPDGHRPARLVRFDGELRRHDPRLGVPSLEVLGREAARRGLVVERDRPGVEEGDRLLLLRRT